MIYLMIELRAPTENAASVTVIVSCIGTLSAMVAPMVGQSGFPYIVVVPSMLALASFTLSFCLIAPGAYLPQAVKVS